MRSQKQQSKRRSNRPRDGYESGGCTAGKTYAGPYGRLYHQPASLGKSKRGLSAGRVQSVALRIICDREDEINAFIPEEYWRLEGDFQ